MNSLKKCHFVDVLTKKSLSPHMIIFRVTTGRSFTRFPTPTEDPIQFAPRTAESAFLQSIFNWEFGRNPDPDPERGLNPSVDESDQSRTSVIHEVQEKRNDGGDVEKAEWRERRPNSYVSHEERHLIVLVVS
jgi:hypothetical protein